MKDEAPQATAAEAAETEVAQAQAEAEQTDGMQTQVAPAAQAKEMKVDAPQACVPDQGIRPMAAGMCGMANPVAGMSREEAERIAAELGDGTDMGTWRTMSGEQFLKWWAASNPQKESEE